MTEVQAIALKDFDRLSDFLMKYESEDPYLISAAYLGVTGRRGLWLYEADGGGVVLALHPNLARTVIVFPPFGSAGVETAFAALAAAGVANDSKIVWARIPGGELGSERVLDWTYPVHVLGVPALLEPRGERFRDYRKNLHRAERLGLTARPLDPRLDREDVIEIASRWGWQNRSQSYSFGDLIAPTMHALHLARVLPIEGVLVVDNNVPVGFGLWEETRPFVGLANGISGVIAGVIRGASEFAVRAQIEALEERGFTEICVGGSETASLDAFKRKLCPVRSVALGSIVQSGWKSRQLAVGM